jgi:hypothetical protein
MGGACANLRARTAALGARCGDHVAGHLFANTDARAAEIMELALAKVRGGNPMAN